MGAQERIYNAEQKIAECNARIRKYEDARESLDCFRATIGIKQDSVNGIQSQAKSKLQELVPYKKYNLPDGYLYDGMSNTLSGFGMGTINLAFVGLSGLALTRYDWYWGQIQAEKVKIEAYELEIAEAEAEIWAAQKAEEAKEAVGDFIDLLTGGTNHSGGGHDF